MTNTTERNREIAETILAQIGGGRALAMMGARDVGFGSGSLMFKPGTNAKRVSAVRIDLEPSDTYTVRIFSGRGVRMREVSTIGDVYADRLRPVLEAETGLYLSL